MARKLLYRISQLNGPTDLYSDSKPDFSKSGVIVFVDGEGHHNFLHPAAGAISITPISVEDDS